MPRFITLDSDNKVIGVRYGLSVVEGEIENDVVEIGQVKQADGTFVTPEPVPTEPFETVEQKLVRLESMNAMLNEDFVGLVDTLIETGVLV